MKTPLLLYFLLLISFCGYGQTPKLFEINEIIVTDTSQRKTAEDFKTLNTHFFEDEKYVVRQTCSGEWGGTVWFKNKKSGIERACSASCPVVVNKLNGKYYVTATLSHMRGFSEIIEISDPEKLAIFKKPKPRGYTTNNKPVYAWGDTESQSTKGANIVFRESGLLVLVSFLYKGQLYHIYTDYDGTYIAYLQDDKLIKIDTISSEKLYPANYSKVIKTTAGHLIAFFDSGETTGYVDIFDNKITLVKYP